MKIHYLNDPCRQLYQESKINLEKPASELSTFYCRLQNEGEEVLERVRAL